MQRPSTTLNEVLQAAAKLQCIVPDAVLVGGTAAAHHAGHRVSLDDDHVVHELGDRFDAVLAALEDTDGWVTARIRRPVLILGSLDGVETGVRNLIRLRPLEVEIFETAHGPVRVPTLEEMLRIKAWLVLIRNATRDYLDVAALADRLGVQAVDTLVGLDEFYADQQGAGGLRLATQVARQLAEPAPYDLAHVDLLHYRSLNVRWRDWSTVADACRWVAVGMLDRIGAAQS